ncbi:hypothetical protein GGX14DRAFT_554162 [Mycena pura]|uniref:Uncharacterized protein n=1 Tax=Mycena pura TaxID=153505 RepID=A0AAD6YWD4_9AGAR|nr:hypothetical protein GGX14DRAFT_554162 [Mycena pura]
MEIISKPSKRVFMELAELRQLCTGRRAQNMKPLGLGEIIVVRTQDAENEWLEAREAVQMKLAGEVICRAHAAHASRTGTDYDPGLKVPDLNLKLLRMVGDPLGCSLANEAITAAGTSIARQRSHHGHWNEHRSPTNTNRFVLHCCRAPLYMGPAAGMSAARTMAVGMSTALHSDSGQCHMLPDRARSDCDDPLSRILRGSLAPRMRSAPVCPQSRRIWLQRVTRLGSVQLKADMPAMRAA